MTQLQLHRSRLALVLSLLITACPNSDDNSGDTEPATSSGSGHGTQSTSSTTGSATGTTTGDPPTGDGTATGTPETETETTGMGGPGLFPLSVSADGTHLVDVDGDPFFINGEAGWSMIVQLTPAQAEAYLDDRVSRSMNTIMVELIEHEFSDDPPNDTAGRSPFADTFDWSTVNDAYFDAAHDMVAAAQERGVLIMLYPSYLGFGGGSQGWFQEMETQTPEVCAGYGAYVADKFADLDNIVWIAGGDYNPPDGSPGELCMIAIIDAIAEGYPGALRSYHGARNTTAFTQQAYPSRIELNGVYTGELSSQGMRDAYDADQGLPLFLIEARYENEFGDAAALRAQSWWSILGGGSGHLIGNNPLWFFGAGWEDELDSQLSRDMVHIAALFNSLAWTGLRPSTTLVSGGGAVGTDGFVAQSMNEAGTLAVAYVPAPAARQLTLDVAALAGPPTLTLFDPSDGSRTALPLEGNNAFTVPDANATGLGDWVVQIDVR